MQIFRQKRPLVQFGLSENDIQICLIRQENKQVSVSWFEKNEVSTNQIVAQAVQFSSDFTIIRAVPFRYIWRKYLILPEHYSPLQIYQHIIQHLKQDLPLPLTQIYFDYQITKLADLHSQQIIIYALEKNQADALVFHKKMHLDCELHCMQRAYHYLSKQSPTAPFLTGYLFQQKIIQFQHNQLKFTHIPDKNIKQFYCYKFSDLNIPETCETILIDYPEEYKKSTELYLSALGASLWNMPLV